ncbi:hypothetical protein PFISCL1PPCAC_15729 [Pristionchus fissidentatus]|uniref:HORMA domain-containing protein n=1 Tax=Pristionchus fissidentatus TaxID=1538716 RepID=A0AAV5W2U4_9BILA|nr:hypothetical protein PFISCL1PPCAC_15729 [Pristionchus fissidentatus]
MMDEELLDFEELERNRYENMKFAKRLVLCSIAEILCQRKLLPTEAFKAIRLRGVKVVVFDVEHDDAYENLVKLGKICDEIEREAVKTLRFLVSCPDNGKEQVGEVFEINFAYGEHITVTIRLGNAVEHLQYDKKSYKKDFQVFIMRLRQFCRLLKDLPADSYGRYHVVYTSGSKMEECASEYFTKVVRAPLVWTGPMQDICGMVGIFNRKQIGVKMRVGTLFGSGATDSVALVEHLNWDNWEEGVWEEQRNINRMTIIQRQQETKMDDVTYQRDSRSEKRMRAMQPLLVEEDRTERRSIDAFEWNDEVNVNPFENVFSSGEKNKEEKKSIVDRNRDEIEKKKKNEIERNRIEKEEEEKKKKERKMMEMRKKEEKKRVEEEKKEREKAVIPKRRRTMEKKKREERREQLSDFSDASYSGSSSSDSAQRGSSIDTAMVEVVGEEAREKEGRMNMRRRRRKLMEDRQKDSNTTLPEGVEEEAVTLRDIESDKGKKMIHSPAESKTTRSGDSIEKTPGVSKMWSKTQ